jgi:hypothetical protein
MMSIPERITFLLQVKLCNAASEPVIMQGRIQVVVHETERTDDVTQIGSYRNGDTGTTMSE